MADDETTPSDEPTASTEPTGGDAPAPEDVVPSSDAPAAPPPPPPVATATTTWDAAPTRKRRWLPVFLVIIGAIVVVGIAGGALFVTRTLPPYEAAYDFIDDLAEGRFRSAADRLCDADQDDPDAAISSVTRNFAGGDNVSVNPFGVDRDGDTAWVKYSISEDDDDDDDFDGDEFTLRVIEEDGDWKPCPGVSAR